MSMQRQLRLLDTKGDDRVSEAMSLKVAFATDDLKQVNQHFGSAERFAIYRIDADSSALLEVVEFGKLDQDGNESKLVDKFAVLQECIAVYCLAVGPSAVRQLMALGIQPLKLQYGSPINTIIHDLQKQLSEGPSGWLARAISSREEKSANRFDEMEEEGWCE